jgi:predicted dienelactone hydrolase
MKNVFSNRGATYVAGPIQTESAATTKLGPQGIETEKGLVIRDAARKKDLPCTVHYPKEGGPFPVILFSHGFGGDRNAFAPVGRHWASCGYVVIHPTHSDGLGRRVGSINGGDAQMNNTRSRFGGLMRGLNDPKAIGDRVADLIAVLDDLDRLPKSVPGLRGKIDTKRIGVGGHSFGAYTTMLIGGVTVDLGSEKAKSFRDKRVQCILPISAQGTGQQGLTPNSWKDLTIPMMTVTGTRDRGSQGQGVDWKKEPYRYSPPGDKYLVVIDGANHFSFGGGLGVGSSAIVECVKRVSTHFWDAYLKGSEVSRETLRSERQGRDTKENPREKMTFERK